MNATPEASCRHKALLAGRPVSLKSRAAVASFAAASGFGAFHSQAASHRARAFSNASLPRSSGPHRAHSSMATLAQAVGPKTAPVFQAARQKRGISRLDSAGLPAAEINKVARSKTAVCWAVMPAKALTARLHAWFSTAD